MYVSKLKAEAFCISIEKALERPPDIKASIRRIRKIINGLPDIKLYVSNQENRVTFHSVTNGKQKYISKKNPQIYAIARRRYLLMLLEILQLTDSSKNSDLIRRRILILKLQDFIQICEKGNLDIGRIVLTRNQYQWFVGTFRQKQPDKTKKLVTAGGLPVRSKSEKEIINRCEAFAIPLHYEEQQIIYVNDLVNGLHDDLLRRGELKGKLYSFRNNYIHWNVPPELEWMNAPGSIWKTYYPPNGTIAIFIDIRVMFFDGTIFLWEHEGMMDNFFYRCNSSERASILTFTNTVSKGAFLETYEHDIDSLGKLTGIIEQHILPWLWF